MKAIKVAWIIANDLLSFDFEKNKFVIQQSIPSFYRRSSIGFKHPLQIEQSSLSITNFKLESILVCSTVCTYRESILQSPYYSICTYRESILQSLYAYRVCSMLTNENLFNNTSSSGWWSYTFSLSYLYLKQKKNYSKANN